MPSILIVDDASAIRRMLDAAFSRAGYDVATAADGESAMRQCVSRCFNVVLSDMQMPGMTGCELAQWIGSSCPATRILLMSGREEGCAGCPFAPRCTIFRKPFLLNEVMDTVARIA